MEILEVIRSRRTARSFDGKSIEDDVTGRILEAGRLAPSAKNRQAWRFIAVRRADIRKAISDAAYGDPRIADAAVVIAACTTNIQYTMPNGQASYPLDIAFAVSFMMLQAEHEGLGSAILSTYDEDVIKDLLSVPYSMRVVLLLAVGYTGEPGGLKIRFPKDRIISYDHW